MKIFKPFLYTSLLFIGFSCTKEIVHEKIIDERQANEKIKVSVIKMDENHITFAKSSLGKAFILIPTLTSSGRHPDVSFIKPLIISFEKVGDDVALFNLTEEQLYDTVPSHRLMQTFKVSSENDSSFTIDLGKGFTSFDSKDSLAIAEKTSFERSKRLIESGEETSIVVKDSFVRSAMSSDTALFIEQEIRIRNESLQDFPDPQDPSNKKMKSQLVAQESTATVTFEIKPYVTHPTFQQKVYDKEQRIGYFINFATKKQVDEPVPQIARWDVDSPLGPITVRIHVSAPPSALQAMHEGILYWNRVAGREILKIGQPFLSDEKQIDRSIHVFWIPWDSAGFARAGVQADPITGEIFRGQVFMTSSWYKMTEESFKLALGSPKPNTPSSISSCILDQAQLLDERLRLSLENPYVEKAALDTIRIVLAHEMGHALGLRHNFAGSSTSNLPDSEYLNNHDRYLKGHAEMTVPTSSTVMDYTRGVDTAINGSAILNSVLPYDVAAIGWGYFNKNIEIGKYQYCSDEHIMLAVTQQKTIYACERFDSQKNILLAEIDKLIESQRYQTLTNFMTLLHSAKSSKSYYTKQKTLEELLASINYSVDSQSYSLDTFLYKDPAATFVSIPSIIDSFLQSLSGSTTIIANGSVTPLLTADAVATGGLAGIVERLFLLQQQAGGKFYETQVTQYFETFDATVTENILTPEELDVVKLKMIEKAKLGDSQFLLSVTKALPFSKQTYVKDPTTNEYKMIPSKLASYLPLGNLDPLISTYVALYESALRKTAFKVKIDSVEKDYGFLNSYDNELDALRNNFSPSNRPSMDYENSKRMTSGLEKMKVASVSNTVDILKTLGMAVPEPVTSLQLTELVSHIEWSRMSGVTIFNLSAEIFELKKIEELK